MSLKALLTRVLALSAFALAGCNGDDKSYTLYRDSIVTQNARIHVATFDAADGDAYNKENCETARELFTSQSGVRTKFWCEKGRFRK